MIKGQHRKMFRKPGLARQALGILASSGELMNEVQPRMRMAQAGAVNKSLFDQATRMVDGMIASGQAPAANRDAAINNLYRYYENQALMNPRPAAPRMQGYMNPADGPIDTTGIRGLPAAVADYEGAGIGSMIGPEGDEPSFLQKIGRGLSYRMDEAKANPGSLRNTLGRATGAGSLSGILDPQAELERREQAQKADDVIAANTPAASVSPNVTAGPMSAAAADAAAELDNKQDVGDEQVKKLEGQQDDTLLNNPIELASEEEKKAIDPFLERYKEMTGNDEDDFWRAITTAGLSIAAGQSEDPAVNIARGALAGLQQYSKSKKDRRDSLFLAEIQARKLKAAETPATIQTLEILRDNPELEEIYSRTIGKTAKVTDKRAADAQLIAAQTAYAEGKEAEGDLALQRALLLSGTDPDLNFSSMKQRMQGSKASVE